jgi:Domain of unknown function (DUF4124)
MRHLCSALILLAAAPAIAAEVYRSIDENGIVVYSDRPAEGAQRVHIATPAPGTPAQAAQTPAPAADADSAGQDETLSGEVARDPTAEELAAERARNCSIAQERADQYRVAHRLYRTLPNGEREYLSDAELDQARSRAEADVANWCN